MFDYFSIITVLTLQILISVLKTVENTITQFYKLPKKSIIPLGAKMVL